MNSPVFYLTDTDDPRMKGNNPWKEYTYLNY